ncbi:MAG TPA: nucleotidyltransferase family protein [Ktedonobacterales bacterium]
MAEGGTTQALILAGGAGTRLRPVLTELNKPMAPVADRPFLEYLLLQLKKHGVEAVTLCVGYKADLIQSYFGTGEPWGLRLSYSHETDFLGTGGAIKRAESLIQAECFFVLNGDSLFDSDLRTLMRCHRETNALATLALAYVEDTRRYGAVGVDAAGRVVSFVEKGKGHAQGLINAGVYVFSRELLDLIPDRQAVSLEHDILPRLIGRGLYGLPSHGYFVDIGVPDDYLGLRSNPSHLLSAVE